LFGYETEQGCFVRLSTVLFENLLHLLAVYQLNKFVLSCREINIFATGFPHSSKDDSVFSLWAGNRKKTIKHEVHESDRKFKGTAIVLAAAMYLRCLQSYRPTPFTSATVSRYGN